MQYRELAVFFERLEQTPGRLEMTRILAELLAQVKPPEVLPVVRLLQGAVAPDWEGLEVGLAEKQILKALAIAAGGSSKWEQGLEKLQKLYHEKGDLGLAAESARKGSTGGKQMRLEAAEVEQDLSVGEVFHGLLAIAKVQGEGSQETKQKTFTQILLKASPLEARYITRTIAGRLRLGVADMTFLDALVAHHLQRGVRSVQELSDEERAEQLAARQALERAYDLRSDLAVVAAALYDGGLPAVQALGIEVGTPVRPMAAERLKTIPEILAKMEGRVALEYKYDGLRVQVHVAADGAVRLFSRRLEEFTAQFPDVVAAARRHLPKGCIVEGEAVALDAAGRLRPFQDLSRRRGRKTDLAAAAAEIPVTLFLFDCLAAGGKPLLDRPMEERRGRLAGLLADGDGPVRLSTLAEATTVEEMEAFFDRAVEEGAEGLMAKDPRAPYKAGSRGFAWIKFKTDYTEALVDTMDLVCIGAFYGRGRRAGWYGALLMAARDPETGTFQSVCKLGTGFSDELLTGLKEKFAQQVSPSRPRAVDSELEPDVWFQPSTVAEVQAAELTLSPIHKAAWGRLKPGAGLAARFPRFTKWREDKSPEQATTVDELVSMHQQQPGRHGAA